MMKKLIFTFVALLALNFTFAKDRVVRNCHLSFKFFGLVEVWSGEIKTYHDDGTVTVTGCGEGGGSWDWFWE
jgi:hypothetical protein